MIFLSGKKKLYKVRAVHENSVEVVPYNESECASCTSSCSGCGISLIALNPKHLKLEPGMKVRSNISTPFQSFLNIAALLVPMVFAVIGYFLSFKIADFFNAAPTEVFKAVTVLVFLFVPSLVIFAFTRHKSELIQLQITGIED